MAANPKILSIQSHVVHGYVGNKSATFPLQVLGLEVDAINSVQFSNHTGYKIFKGQVLNENDLDDLLDGLKGNGIDFYSHLLTGYVGNPSFLQRIGNAVKYLKGVNNNMIYVCDPVMGDNGQMYVPESLLPVYRDEIIPLADIITPNQYELELLSGNSINSLDDAWNAIQVFHNKGCPTIVMSSSNLGSKNELIALASSTKGGKRTKAMAKIPKLDAIFTGTGDLFAALLLAWMHKTNDDLVKSLNNTLSTLQSVLKRTHNNAKQYGAGDGPLNCEKLELQLIQSKADIENPQNIVNCDILS